jgi:hypothetical protein
MGSSGASPLQVHDWQQAGLCVPGRQVQQPGGHGNSGGRLASVPKGKGSGYIGLRTLSRRRGQGLGGGAGGASCRGGCKPPVERGELFCVLGLPHTQQEQARDKGLHPPRQLRRAAGYRALAPAALGRAGAGAAAGGVISASRGAPRQQAAAARRGPRGIAFGGGSGPGPGRAGRAAHQRAGSAGPDTASG